jgi:hypothetical protein
MYRLLKLSVVIGTALGLCACASVTVRPVKNGEGSKGVDLDAKESGVRFYRPALHVWLTRAAPSDKVGVVTTEEGVTLEDSHESKPPSPPNTATQKNAKTNKTTSIRSTQGESIVAQFVMLPDLTQEYIVQWNAGIGSVNPNFSLADGWNLTSFNSTVDSKANEHLTAAAAVGTAIASFGAAGAGAFTNDPNYKGPGLYKMEFSTGHYSLGAQILALP